jgi:hypothetical protein
MPRSLLHPQNKCQLSFTRLKSYTLNNQTAAMSCPFNVNVLVGMIVDNANVRLIASS